jgi:hypothetical protein
MLTQKPKIDPRVRAKLEELGADVIRAKLARHIGGLAPHGHRTSGREDSGVEIDTAAGILDRRAE